MHLHERMVGGGVFFRNSSCSHIVSYSTATAYNGGSLASNNFHTALTHQDMMMLEDWHSA